MDTSTMISHLEANGHVTMSIAQVGDLCDIDHRVKNGDESGWRGDPTMGIYFNVDTKMFEVWGLDRAGKSYLACSHDRLDHQILVKLRQGDPRKHDVIQEVLDANTKMRDDDARRQRAALEEFADKVAWGIRRDFAQHLGGRGAVHVVNGRKKEN